MTIENLKNFIILGSQKTESKSDPDFKIFDEISLVNLSINKALSMSNDMTYEQQKEYVFDKLKIWSYAILTNLSGFDKLTREDNLLILDVFREDYFELILENLNQFSKLNLDDEKTIVIEALAKGYKKILLANKHKLTGLMGSFEGKLWLKNVVEEANQTRQYKVVRIKK